MNGDVHGDDLEFEALLGDVGRTVEGDLQANAGVPDLLAVVELAHRLDPARVPQTAVDEVSTYAPVVSLQQGRRLRQSRNDDAFDDIVRDIRSHVDQDVARALGAPTSAAGAPSEPVAAEVTSQTWKWAVALLAAVALLGIGIGIGTLRGTELKRNVPDDPNTALLSPHATDGERAAFDRGARSQRKQDGLGPDLSDDAVDEEPEPEPEPETETETAAVAEPKTRSRRKPAPVSAETMAEKLDRLEHEANAAWKAGRHAEAASTYRSIIKLDRRGSWAESAYGELFTLQRQRGNPVASLWTAYLRRFPDGRFADDARAGLCRRAPDGEKVECWTTYLDKTPKGSFRQQAVREITQYSGGATP